MRDDLRSKSVERAADLPTEDDALAAALAAYRSVLPATSGPLNHGPRDGNPRRAGRVGSGGRP